MINSNLRAMPNIPEELEAIVRLPGVKRWGMVETFRPQSVAEHSATVAMLVYYVSVSAPGMFFGPANSTVGPALFHDIGEAFIGDIPTPTKREVPVIATLEEQVTPTNFKFVLPECVVDLIKLCDSAEAIRYARRFGADSVGEWADNQVSGRFQKYIKELHRVWPEEVSDHVAIILTQYIRA